MKRSGVPAALAAMAAAAVIVTGGLAALGWPADRYRDNDFAGFYLGARAVLEGLDPYHLPTWLALHDRIGSAGLEIVPRGSAFGYPLVTAVAFAPIGLLPIALAAPAWLVTQAALALVALIAFGRQVLGPTARRDLPLVIALAAGSQPAWVLAEGGNIGGFLLAFVAGALALLLAGRPWAAGLVLGLLVVKPHLFLLFVPLLLLFLLLSVGRGAAARLAAGGLISAGGLLALSFVLRPGWPAEWLGPVGRIGSAPVGRANAYGVMPHDARWLGLLIVAALLIGLGIWVRRRPLGLAGRAVGALAISLIASPYGWSYDQLVLATAAAVGIGYAATLGPGPRLRALILLILVTVLLPWLLYVLAFSNGEEAWSAIAPIALLGTLMILSSAVPSVSAARWTRAPAIR